MADSDFEKAAPLSRDYASLYANNFNPSSKQGRLPKEWEKVTVARELHLHSEETHETVGLHPFKRTAADAPAT